MRTVRDAIFIPAFMLSLTGCCAQQARLQARGREVVLATTTSLQETGLLDSLATAFERETGIRLRVVAVGSGQALRLGDRGDADVILAHAPGAELEFLARGSGIDRRLVAWNNFVIVGPRGDPAGVRRASSAAGALVSIARSRALFVSRADSSGTHIRELELWRAAGGRPDWDGYLEAGQGASATLLIASERRAYALCDRSTFLALRSRLDLEELLGGDPQLLNPYHVIRVNPLGRTGVNGAGARAFADFVVSATAQDLIDGYGRSRFGAPLFTAGAPPAAARDFTPRR